MRVTSHKVCSYPSGVYNTSICRFGAPVFFSQPHFYLVDPYYPDLVSKGMSPKSTLHNTYLRIEPRAGVPTDVTASFHINVLVDKVSGISMLKDVTKTYFPVLWFENRTGVLYDLVFKMKLPVRKRTPAPSSTRVLRRRVRTERWGCGGRNL
jgi:hypothetical protein